MKKTITSWLYFVIGAINIGAFFLGFEQVEQLSKALLMPILVFYVYARAAGEVTLARLLLAVALVFSWFGDLLLLYISTSEWYFIGGLGMFLTAHLIYSFVFNRSTFEKLRFNAAKLIPVFILAFVIATRVIPSTGKLMIPVITYSICLFTMLGYAKLREGITTKLSYIFVLTGGLLFVVSDSLIAFNKFVVAIPYPSALIMATYIPAQFLITHGVMIHPVSNLKKQEN